MSLSRHQMTAAKMVGVVVLMGSLSWASVPFYDWFCRVTGFGGVTGVAEKASDVVLDRKQRILLPEEGAMQALERVIALERAQGVLTRDVARVDMRLPTRATVKMNKQATDAWWDIKQ